MCGRFAFFASPDAIAEQFGIVEPPPIEARYNLSPTQPVPVIRRRRDGAARLHLLRWGLVPHWAKDPAMGARMINARAETVADRPAFRDAFLRRRCLVLASGFYEWSRSPSGKRPFFISRADGEIMAFAGLWERWRDGADQVLESCVIITTGASAPVAEIHERMPVLLAADAQSRWLAPGAGKAEWLRQLAPGDGPELDVRAVDRAVNNPRNEGVELLTPAAGE